MDGRTAYMALDLTNALVMNHAAIATLAYADEHDKNHDEAQVQLKKKAQALDGVLHALVQGDSLAAMAVLCTVVGWHTDRTMQAAPARLRDGLKQASSKTPETMLGRLEVIVEKWREIVTSGNDGAAADAGGDSAS